MGLRLSVREQAWREHVATVAAATPGLIPVVKGNGYGFGRGNLMRIAAGLGHQIAVGTVFEAADVPADRQAVVLTPHIDRLPATVPKGAMLTVGSVDHVDALHRNGWTGAVAVKLRSPMQRYGAAVDELRGLLSAIATAGFEPACYSLHLALTPPPHGNRETVETWLSHLDPRLPIALSHVGPADYADLCAAHPREQFQLRLGTSLWHGDKSLLYLSADVLDVHTVHAGARVGYRATFVERNGSIVLVGAGSAHGVQTLDNGSSPFHFNRRRLALIEPPHMHSSMLFVEDGLATPKVGDRVDVQRPLITTQVDEVDWIRD